jgi:hypothetical protein
MWKIYGQVEVEISRFIPGLVMKQYWIDGATKTLKKYWRNIDKPEEGNGIKCGSCILASGEILTK